LYCGGGEGEEKKEEEVVVVMRVGKAMITATTVGFLFQILSVKPLSPEIQNLAPRRFRSQVATATVIL